MQLQNSAPRVIDAAQGVAFFPAEPKWLPEQHSLSSFEEPFIHVPTTSTYLYPVEIL